MQIADKWISEIKLRFLNLKISAVNELFLVHVWIIFLILWTCGINSSYILAVNQFFKQ